MGTHLKKEKKSKQVPGSGVNLEKWVGTWLAIESM